MKYQDLILQIDLALGGILNAFLHHEGTVAQGVFVFEQVAAPAGYVGVLACLDRSGEAVDAADFGVDLRRRLKDAERVGSAAQPCAVFPAVLDVVVHGDEVRAVAELYPAPQYDLASAAQPLLVDVQLAVELRRL